MAVEILMVKEMNRLAPCDPIGGDDLRKIPQGTVVRVAITRPRNVGHHRKWFALLKVVFESQSHYATLKQVLTRFKKATNLGEWMSIDGRDVFIPGSISFAQMDQADFEQWYTNAIDVLRNGLLPKVRNDDLKRRVEDIIAGNAA